MSGLTKETVDIIEFSQKLNLKIEFKGRELLTFSSMSVERPGLQLAGFSDYFDPRRIVVLGLSECEYLKTFSAEERMEKLSRLFQFGELPCVIMSRNLPVPEELMKAAKEVNCPIFTSPKVTTDLMSDLYIYLNRLLAPMCTEHGVLLEVFGVGVLLKGQSGVGKSETAIELIKRGHRLVADDCVIIKEIANELYGSCPDRIRYFLEIRGIGVINVKNMYGSGSVLGEKKIELAIELETRQIGKDYDRIGDKEESVEYLGVSIPKLTIPVSPGRNLAIIVEVAARNYRLKQMGDDASKELLERCFSKN